MTEAHHVCGNHLMEVVDGKLGEKLRKDFFMYKDGVMIDKTDKWILPTNFSKFANLIHKFHYHSSDVVISTFPKSGTTWAQEIVWNLLHNPNLDHRDAEVSIDARSPSFQGDMLLATTGAPPLNPEGQLLKRFKMLFPGKEASEGVLIHLTALHPPPRLIRTHIPLAFLPSNLPDLCKVIYVVRDPRDVMNSLHFFMRLHVLYGFKGSWTEFVDYFIHDKICFGPYWKHVQIAWEMRDHPNFLFLFYEDFIEDVEREVRKIDKFLGTKRTDQQIKNVIECSALDSRKEKSKVSPLTSNNYRYFNMDVLNENKGFFRKGQYIHSMEVGNWKSSFNSEATEKVTEWMRKHLTEFGNDFRYHPE